MSDCFKYLRKIFAFGTNTDTVQVWYFNSSYETNVILLLVNVFVISVLEDDTIEIC